MNIMIRPIGRIFLIFREVMLCCVFRRQTFSPNETLMITVQIETLIECLCECVRKRQSRTSIYGGRHWPQWASMM